MLQLINNVNQIWGAFWQWQVTVLNVFLAISVGNVQYTYFWLYILFHLTKSLGNDQFWWTYNILAFWLISPVFLTVSMVCIGIVRFRGKMSQCTHISPYIVVYTPSCSHIRLPWPKCWSLALFMATHPSFVYKLMTYKTYGMWYVFFLEIQLHLHIHLHIMILHSLITGERESAHLSSHHLHHMVSVFHFIFHMLLMS